MQSKHELTGLNEKALSENLPLYQLYFDYCFSTLKDKEKAHQFAMVMFDAFSKIGIHNFLTLAFNVEDGIGDYVSQIYFIEKINHIFGKINNLKMKNISYVSDEKSGIAGRVRKDHIPEETVGFLENTWWHNSPDRKKQNIIGMPQSEEENMFIQEIMSQADFLFNIAVGLHLDESSQLKTKKLSLFTHYDTPAISLLPQSYFASWTEYTFQHKGSTEKFANSYIDPIYRGPIFTERSMGWHDQQMGIRFYQDIDKAAKKSKEELFNSLGHNFFTKLGYVKGESVETYLKNNSFAIGYLQAIKATGKFIEIAAGTSAQQNNMNIFVNISEICWERYGEMYFDPQLENKIKEFGYTSIEVIGGDACIYKKTLKSSQDHGGYPERILRLVQFKGISDKDKYLLYGLSEMNASSGDTSLSEVITSGLTYGNDAPLPFLQKFCTSTSSCIKSLIAELEIFERMQNTMHPELKAYLNFLEKQYIEFDSNIFAHLFRLEYKQSDLDEIKTNRSKIISSWKELCTFLYKNRNEKDHFGELITTYTFHHLLKHNNLDKFKEMAILLGRNALKNETLLHLAVKLNKVEAARFIIDNQLCDINQIHPFNGYTALHLAVHYQSEEMVKLLLENGIDANILDQNKNSAMQLASTITNNKIDIKNITEEIEISRQYRAEIKKDENVTEIPSAIQSVLMPPRQEKPQPTTFEPAETKEMRTQEEIHSPKKEEPPSLAKQKELGESLPGVVKFDSTPQSSQKEKYSSQAETFEHKSKPQKKTLPPDQKTGFTMFDLTEIKPETDRMIDLKSGLFSAIKSDILEQIKMLIKETNSYKKLLSRQKNKLKTDPADPKNKQRAKFLKKLDNCKTLHELAMYLSSQYRSSPYLSDSDDQFTFFKKANELCQSLSRETGPFRSGTGQILKNLEEDFHAIMLANVNQNTFQSLFGPRPLAEQKKTRGL